MQECKNGTPHLVIDAEFSKKMRMCHACLKTANWLQTPDANIRVMAGKGGFWKAFYGQWGKEYPLDDSGVLIASGHVVAGVRDNFNHYIKLLKSSIDISLRKGYTPDERFLFQGSVDIQFFSMRIDDSQLERVLRLVSNKRRLPTLRMKAREWKIWMPQVEPLNPYLRGVYPEVICPTGISYIAESEMPYSPSKLLFETSGRFDVQFYFGREKYYLDVDVE